MHVARRLSGVIAVGRGLRRGPAKIVATGLLLLACGHGPVRAATGDGAEPLLTLEDGRIVWRANASMGEPPLVARVVRHAMAEAGDADVRESAVALEILSRHALARGWALTRMGERALAAGDSARADSCWWLASEQPQAFQWTAARARHDLLRAMRGDRAALGALVRPPCCGDDEKLANLMFARARLGAGDTLAAFAEFAGRDIPLDSIPPALAWLERVYRDAAPDAAAALLPAAARLWSRRAARIGPLEWLLDGVERLPPGRARFEATLAGAAALRGMRAHARARTVLGALVPPGGGAVADSADHGAIALALARVERGAERLDAADRHFAEAIRWTRGAALRNLDDPRREIAAAAIRQRGELALSRGRLAEARGIFDRAPPFAERPFDAALLSILLGERGDAVRRLARMSDDDAAYWRGALTARGDSNLRVVAGRPWFDFYPVMARERTGTELEPVTPWAAAPSAHGPPAVRAAELLFHVGARTDAALALEVANALERGEDPAVPGHYPGADGAAWLRAARVAYQSGAFPLGIRLAHKARYRAGGAALAQGFARESAIPWLYPPAFDSLYASAAATSGVDVALLAAIGWQESFFDARAVSRAGALGVMQFMPATALALARQLGEPAPSEEDMLDPARSIRFGAHYVATLLAQFGGEAPPALAAYNAGPGRARAWIRRANGDRGALFCEVIGFDETVNYVKNIVATRQAYRRLRPGWAR
jgi:soluble lytic murein transglycosylase